MNKYIIRSFGWKMASIVIILLWQAIYWILPGVREWMKSNVSYGLIYTGCFITIFIICFVISVINENKAFKNTIK